MQAQAHRPLPTLRKPPYTFWGIQMHVVYLQAYWLHLTKSKFMGQISRQTSECKFDKLRQWGMDR